MSTLKDILNKESDRPSMDGWRVIHLHREGTFLRAYERSAWLFLRFVKEGYKVSNRAYKGYDDTVAMIGFPEASLDKALADDRCFGFGKTMAGDTGIDILLTPEVLPDGYETELLEKDFRKWKDALPKDEAKKDGKTGLENAPRQMSATAILQKVLAYPVESRSPLDCQSFLFEIRRDIAALF